MSTAAFVNIPTTWIRYSQNCAAKLPAGCNVICNEEVLDMAGQQRSAIKVLWWDNPECIKNVANFDANTGEYIGHCE